MTSLLVRLVQRLRDGQALAVYTGGRFTAVLTRPLLLFLTNNYLGQRAAQGLAIVFLANVLGMSAIAADPYRRYYSRHFGSECFNSYPFFRYLASCILLIGVGVIVVAAVSLSLSHSLALAASAIFYFFSEKLADELLRYRLFERNFDVWGRSNIFRSTLQIASFLIVLVMYCRATSLWLPVMAFSMGNLLVFVPQLPFALWRLMGRISLLRWVSLRAIRALYADGMLWVLALLTSGLAYLDRSLAALVASDMLPQFTLASMCLSSVQLMIDFFYVSRHRREYLEGQITVAGIIKSVEFPVVLGSGVVIGLTACLATLHFSHRGGELPLSYIVSICVMQVSLALIGGVREIPYWRGSINQLVVLELGFYGLFSTILAAAWVFHLPAIEIFAAAACCVVIRLAAYTRLSTMSNRRPPAVKQPAEPSVVLSTAAVTFTD